MVATVPKAKEKAKARASKFITCKTKTGEQRKKFGMSPIIGVSHL